jgi:hypothetical protein
MTTSGRAIDKQRRVARVSLTEMACRSPALVLLGLSLFVAPSSGCDDTTGVYLSIYGGSVVADRVEVTAVTPRGMRTRELPLVPNGALLSWPVSFVATFPADIGTASFTVTAYHGDVATGSGALGALAVPPHTVVSRDVAIGDGVIGGDGGTGSDGGSGDAGMPGLPNTVKYAHTLTVPRHLVSASLGSQSLLDYPLLVSISHPTLRSAAAGGHVANGDGSDLRFLASGATCGVGATCTLDHEIERYDPNAGILVAWVRIPQLGTAAAPTDTTITVGYGAADPGAAPDARRVWDSGFHGVWHLDSGVNDSTAGVHHGVATGTSSAPAQIAGGLAFNGTSDFVDVATSTAFDFGVDADFTLSLWAKTRQTGAGQSPRLISRRDGKPQGFEVVLHTLNNDDAWFGALDSSSGAATARGSTNLASSGTWHLVSVVRRAGQLVAYEDLSPSSPMAGATGSLATTVPLRFGAASGTTATQLFAGSQDEVRISAVARSQEWILTDYATQSGPPNTLTLGDEFQN